MSLGYNSKTDNFLWVGQMGVDTALSNIQKTCHYRDHKWKHSKYPRWYRLNFISFDSTFPMALAQIAPPAKSPNDWPWNMALVGGHILSN